MGRGSGRQGWRRLGRGNEEAKAGKEGERMRQSGDVELEPYGGGVS